MHCSKASEEILLLWRLRDSMAAMHVGAEEVFRDRGRSPSVTIARPENPAPALSLRVVGRLMGRGPSPDRPLLRLLLGGKGDGGA